MPAADDIQISPPSISLPKGGGAIRGIGEKFAANPVTGTGSMTVPIATSPGRSGFGPQLSLSYDSGAGNSPFGFGWSLSLPSITRKTDKGLPKYQDLDESDVFILSGSEDLVPEFDKDSTGNWVIEDGKYVIHDKPRTVGGVRYSVRRYRPRIEGLFARIERWTNKTDATDVCWRSISKDNITTWYGKTENSRIFDPNDKKRVFSWLICETSDGKGNVIIYRYKEEDSENVETARLNERNRTTETRKVNRYLKRICYGNRKSHLPKLTATEWQQPPEPGVVNNVPNYLFELIFDYDDGHYSEDAPDSEGRVLAHPVYSPHNAKWSARVDPFSTYRAAFEIRTYRFCHRVLMFHHFPDELGTPDCLVRSTDFTYSFEDKPTDARSPIYSFLDSVTQSGYVRQANGSYLKKSLPPVGFDYTKPEVHEVVHDVDPQSLENLPFGIDGTRYQWIDLDGEGLSGILTQQAEGWFYKRNLSPVNVVRKNGEEHVEASFAPLELVAKKPSLAVPGSDQQFLDLGGDGQLDLVILRGPTPGFFERTQDGSWEPFKPFASLPGVDWDDPNLKLVDLTGDGRADVLITENEVFSWYPFLAEDHFGPAEQVPQNLDEEKGPRLVFADAEHSIYLGDLSGDGLSDLVRIRKGEVCYWPNLGYGRFGPKVTMDNSPWFDNPDQFDPRRIQLADIDGSGTTDIIYLCRGGIDLYFNQSGNSWSQPRHLKSYPQTDNLSSVTAMDLLGNGTACLVWSSPLPGNARRPMRYIDLMGANKPHLLIKVQNNLGAETEVQYSPSTKFYVADKLAGKPWITRVPFPVHVVEKVTVKDKWRKTEFSSTYTYHHGYYDGIEREFRGFGRVEHLDVDKYGNFAKLHKNNPYVTDDQKLYQPPVKTITWFHTGAFLDRETILSHFEDEYFPKWFEALDPTRTNVLGTFRENGLPEPDLDAQGFSVEEWREALRACRGMTLREEVYELDVQALSNQEHRPVKLFSTAYHNCHIQRLQPKERNPHAVFLVTEGEAISYHYEMDLTAGTLRPDPRIAHTLNLSIDEFGNVQQAVAVVYPRSGRHRDPSLPNNTEDLIAQVQRERHLTYTETAYTRDVENHGNHRVRVPCEVSTHELAGAVPAGGFYFTLRDLRRYRLSPKRYQKGRKPGDINVTDVPYHQTPDGTTVQKRLVERVRTLFFKNLKTFLPLGKLNALALKYEDYKLALTDEMLRRVFGTTKLTQSVRADLNDSAVSGYMSGQGLVDRFPDEETDGEYWMRSGTAGFSDKADEHFYLPGRYTDAFGSQTTIEFDRKYDLFVESSTDALGNRVRINEFDYRVLSPRAMKDINDNLTEMRYDILGLPAVMAIKGKGNEGDNLNNVTAALLDPSLGTVINYFQQDFDASEARRLLGTATARYIYYLGEEEQGGNIRFATHPPAAGSMLREKHVAQLDRAEVSKLQVAFEYSDGMGTVLVKKAQSEPEEGKRKLRWIATGKTVLNNKGKPVKQYEPYFSQTEHRFDETETEDEIGVTPIMYYDAVGRLIRTELPDGSFSRVEFSPWHVTTYDPNDTAYDPVGNQHSDWYQRRVNPAHPRFAEFNTPEDRRAADLTRVHANTPSQVFLDSLGRDVVAVAHNKFEYRNGPVGNEKYATFTKLDAEGKPLWIRDPKRNLVMQYIVPAKSTRSIDEPNEDIPANAVPCYDIAGNLLFQHSMDAGDRWMLNDAGGKPLYAWDANERLDSNGATVMENRRFNTKYDQLHRPTEQWFFINNGVAQMIERFSYGESAMNPRQNNLRGQLREHFDQSGRRTIQRYDFKGNVLSVERKLASSYRAPVIGWQTGSPTVGLETETFMQITEYDALNRITMLHNWHQGAGSRVAVFEPSYNERGVLRSEDLVIRAEKTAGGYTENTQSQRTAAIKAITYNAKAQREQIKYGNGTITRYEYDPETFRLVQLRTTRPNYDPVFPSRRSRFKNDRVLQNLFYTYDPVGNITEIYDDAYEPAFFQNQKVDPQNEYTYDALYRLIAATGRENGALMGPPANIEADPIAIEFPIQRGDPNALRKYTQTYRYDSVGNIERMRHEAGNGSWTRDYAYAFDDRAQPASNRLWQTWTGGNRTQAITYEHDTHGNMLSLLNVAQAQYIRWDYRDMIRELDLQGGGRAYYNYDSGKQRSRKVIATQNGTKQWERLNLGGFELYRRYVGGALVEEIESHHLMDGALRTLLVEDVLSTDRSRLPTGSIHRYQYSNHLGSVSLELKDDAQITSYEEYHPYGTSAYRAVENEIEAPPKRYRYTGMERDEESGLNYHGARYCSSSLGRWISCDPVGGTPLYRYVFDNPIYFQDPDGKVPVAYEVADAWENREKERRPPGIITGARTGEELASWWGRLAERMGGAVVDVLGTDPSGVEFATKVTTTVTVVGGVLAAFDDPDSVVRGIMRLGTGSAQGLNDIRAGNTTLGVSKMIAEAAQVVQIAGGGISIARTVGVPGTYQVTSPLPTAPAAEAPAPAELPPPAEVARIPAASVPPNTTLLPPEFKFGDVKPLTDIGAATEHLAEMTGRYADAEYARSALAFYDPASIAGGKIDVYLQVFDPLEPGQTMRQVVWEQKIGQVEVPYGPFASELKFGQAIEAPVIELVEQVTGQQFAPKAGPWIKGPDLFDPSIPWKPQ